MAGGLTIRGSCTSVEPGYNYRATTAVGENLDSHEVNTFGLCHYLLLGELQLERNYLHAQRPDNCNRSTLGAAEFLRRGF
jgi:hypothetical protein